MESHNYALKMQKEMIKEIEAVRPEFLVFVRVFTSWLDRADSEKLIFTWFDDYQRKHYRRVGIVDILSLRRTAYLWGPECSKYKPRSEQFIVVFQRSD
jgi:hypothetical protein